MMRQERQAVLTAGYYSPHAHHHHHHPPLHSHAALHSPSAFHPAPPHYHDPALASLAYPYRHATNPQQTAPGPSAAAAPAEQTTQLSLAQAAGARPYQHQHHSSFRQQQQTATSSHQQHRTRAQTRQRQHSAMAYPPDDQTGNDELAELQKLSNEYQPEATGPLVGQRQPSTAITTEYASADPIYQAKTAALPQKYSHYRTVRGDGTCGWRAVAFGYFEALIHHGDSNVFAMEEARLRSMFNVMAQAGFQQMLFEDFATETFDLLRKVSNAMSLGTAEDALMEAFNDEMVQNYIITHFRTLTAAHMKTHEENYAPWLSTETVDQYCERSVMPVHAEIDHVGLVALKDCLLSPAGMSLEVMYLDRSEGSEVTMHRFDPVNGGGYTIGSVRLLYRPGHYDLLYKPDDLPAPPPPPAAVPTYLQYGSSHEPVYDLGVSDFLTSIPGMSYANVSQTSWMSSSYGSGVDFLNTPAPVQTCAQPLPTPSAPAPQPQISSQPVYVPASTPTQMVPPPTQLTHELAIRTSVPQPTMAHTDFQHQIGGGPFRPSAWQYEPDFLHATSQVPFQTSIFRNSHFNTAHFLNPEFQPEQWDPDDEYATATSSSSKSSRHKNSG